jgi:hypothetical protein
MNEKIIKLTSAGGKYRYILLLLAAGLALILLSGGKSRTAAAAASPSDEEARAEYVISRIAGAGDTSVLLSESGAVVVCRGADDPGVRLDVTQAVCAYTGLTSDKVTILKLEGKNIEEASA